MAPPPHSKPENTLKRAQELIGVEQQQAALQLLHEHVTSKRTRNSPIASLEPVMILFVELCVDLRKGKLAKDGLYQYKNTAQNTNVGTIETVFKRFIELAEQKVTEAQAKADEVQSSLEPSDDKNVDDLEATETPESILLSTVSGEQSRDRTDRAIVTPWLKFLWETYRTVLDIFKNNARLELMYQSTAHQAFQFCSKYARKTEFRRLCELLRNHLQNAAKFSSQMHAINLSDPDTLQRHLDTRFQQLNVAVELELWQEAFRSVEDIHTLLSLSKRPAKNIMMANYFEKLTRIFLVSENYLFHAAAYSRYYNLLRQSAAAVASGQSPKKDNPAVTEADMTKAASFVLLSALAIPVISTSRSRGALVDVDEARKNKNSRLTNLLGMSQAPTRAILFKDALSKGLLKRARPEIRDLYNILEVDFHPLSICKKISPILSQIGADEGMEKYVGPLQQVILTRLFQQLSQVYDSVKIEFVLGLAQFPEPFHVSAGTIEKFIMNGCKKGDLAIRTDHATGVLTFDSDVFSSAKAMHPGSGAGSAEIESRSVQRLQSTPAEIVRSQLTRLAKSLFVTCQYVDPSFNSERQRNKEAALERAKEGAEKEHQEILTRRDIISQKKEAALKAQQAKENEEQTKRLIRQQQIKDEEARRLAEEQKQRADQRIKAEQKRIQREEMEKQIKELKATTKVDIELPEDLDDLDSQRIRILKLQALEREKNQLGEQLRIAGKRIDHLERAYRKEEIKHLKTDYEKQQEEDLAAYEKAKAEELKESEERHKADVELKHRLSRLVSPYQTFVKTVKEQRKAEFEKRQKIAQKELESKKAARVKEVKERIAREKKEREEAERRQREEEEREREEAEAKAKAAEEKAAHIAELKAKREQERAAADEVARLQRQREEEALARRKAGAGAPRAVPDRTFSREPAAEPSSASGPPKIALPGGKPSWREREAMKAAGQAPPPASTSPAPAPAATSPAPEAEASKRSGYVPPALRQGGAPGGGWREREASGSGRAPPARAERPERTESPATGGRYEAARGGDRWGSDRKPASPANAGGYVPPGARGGAPPREGEGERPPAQAPAGGKYVPRHLRDRQ
ncbi:Eukaryotic translation initiation factor 3 subunit A [Alternaria arborescens]|uniref:Eukaryotic translation initiation factor 3 subunit A n=1 Tax=Alternaria arborescens TaxID=156630 RepID=A0A4Q4SJL5_9PLEO|nr:Eukaryotic translation initiation factor 3 subunit A [Alternaria arborescens]RYN22548.1 Eukaryotic translation initiation factor 3 subunit A [Alternaria arborescens]RYO28011.1 Eukaryotic translation initiation factor 3 subunit A [Alternaria arborescens]RYO70256.1 Eukaryotic translation initiation factor 3 subunit A [Alternaria arborescens]